VIINEAVTGVISIVIGYTLGSIPSAYIMTRLVSGKDIRQMGGGNVGFLNTYREVGATAGFTVLFVDLAKGAVAIAIAYWLLALTDLTRPWVLAAGMAAVIGHNWPVWLKFSGGKGAATAMGGAALLMLLYGYWQGLLIYLGIFLIFCVITRNVALSAGLSLFSLPFIAWLGVKEALFTTWAAIIALLIGLLFLPTARKAWARTRNKKDIVFDRWHRKKK